MQAKKYLVLIWSVFVLIPALPTLGKAGDLPAPTGEVLLTISGTIEHANATSPEGQPVALFDRAMLEAIPTHITKTKTAWTDGEVAFSGPKLADVLKLVGVESGVLIAQAINDYAIEIPVSDALDWDVILAMETDGVPLSVRTKGPLWVIYPWSDHPELRKDLYWGRSIWQLISIEAK